MPNQKTILLVGYGWFKSIPEGETNSAEMIARALDGEEILSASGSVCGAVHGLVVPVVWDRAFEETKAVIERIKPDIVLALGTHAAAAAMRPEPYGVNWRRGRDALPEDPDCETEYDCPIIPGGEAFLRGTLPFDAMTRAMLAAGIPARTGSLEPAREGDPFPHRCTAGLYLCNDMAYRLAHLAQTCAHPMRTGFMHVPTQPAYAAAQRLKALQNGDPDLIAQPMLPSMPLEMMIKGTLEALRACLDIG